MRVGPLARCVARPKRVTNSHVATRAPWRYSAPRSATCPPDSRTVCGPSSDPVPRLEDNERPASITEGRRRRESRGAGSDDDAV